MRPRLTFSLSALPALALPAVAACFLPPYEVVGGGGASSSSSSSGSSSTSSGTAGAAPALCTGTVASTSSSGGAVHFAGQMSAAQSIGGLAGDTAGGAYVAGTFANGGVDLGGMSVSLAGTVNSYLVHVNSAGAIGWRAHLGGAGDAELRAVLRVGSEIIAAGRLKGNIADPMLISSGGDDVLLIRYKNDGTAVAGAVFGDGESQVANALASDVSGALYIAGGFGGTLSFGGAAGKTSQDTTSTDAYVAQFNQAGGPVWMRTFGVAGTSESVTALAVTGLNPVIYAAGTYDGATNIGIELDAPPSGAVASFVTRMEQLGSSHAWTRVFVSDLPGGVVRARAVVATGPTGVVAVVGTAQGSVDFGGGARHCSSDSAHTGAFVVRLDGAGAHLESACFSGDGDVEASSVAFTDQGDAVIAGSFTGTVDFGGGARTASSKSAYLLRVGAGGACGLDVYPSAAAARVITAGQLAILAGTFKGTTSVGGVPLTSVGAPDVFVARVPVP